MNTVSAKKGSYEGKFSNTVSRVRRTLNRSMVRIRKGKFSNRVRRVRRFLNRSIPLNETGNKVSRVSSLFLFLQEKGYKKVNFQKG